MSLRAIAIIPARGGSKGLPGKNILPFCGKPLIGWTIEAARSSGVFAKVVVSTDCEAIAAIAREHGAEVPFMRPPELAGDTSLVSDMIAHLLEALAAEGEQFDALCLLQPTSPLRTSRHLQEAFERFEAKPELPLASVTESPVQPGWMRAINQEDEIEMLLADEAMERPRQLGGPIYVLNGAIYFTTCEAFARTGSLHANPGNYYVMEPSASVDIDTKSEFRIAEFLMEESRA